MHMQRVADKFLKKLDGLEYGSIELITPDGRTRVFEGRYPGARGKLNLFDWRAVYNLALNGDIGFAEDYRAGLWEAANLQDVVSLALQNDRVMDGYLFGTAAGRMAARLSQLLRINTLRGSRKNVGAHYDLGNDFYSLWLDPTMTYSSALYSAPRESLMAAQINKYDRIIDRLGNARGSIVEIGCGWGGFADRATQRGDFGIRAITLSENQHKYASERLKGRAHVVIEDYRHLQGRFDNIVSIEMFEAVGEQYWKTYFDKVQSLLARNGRAVVQTITIAEPHFEKYRASGDFIRKFIFPGGMLPSAERFERAAAASGLKVTDRLTFGRDYARTLDTWLDTFEQKHADVRALGYDEGFIRMWRLYLAACSAAFRIGRTDVMQMELMHV